MVEKCPESDPAYQLLARSVGYLEAARVIVEKEGNRPTLRAPILHLVAHALEVLFKHELIKNGRTVDEVREEFGHDIKKLWDDIGLKKLRCSSRSQARVSWDIAMNCGKYEDDFRGDPVKILDEYIGKLSNLHSKRSDYALRYIASPDLQGPVPLLLIDTFESVAKEIACLLPGGGCTPARNSSGNG